MKTNQHLSKLTLESILTGRLNPESSPDVRNHIRECKQCSDYLEKGLESATYIREHYPDWNTLKESRAERRPQMFRFPSMPVFKLRPLAIAAVLLFSIAGVWIFLKTPGVPDYGVKGGIAVMLHINGQTFHKGEAVILCAPGDTLRCSVLSERSIYCALFYKDDSQSIQRYLPETGDAAIQTGGNDGAILPNAIVLDANWKFEMLYCVTSRKPFSCDHAKQFLEEKLKQGDKQLTKDASFETTIFALRNRTE